MSENNLMSCGVEIKLTSDAWPKVSSVAFHHIIQIWQPGYLDVCPHIVTDVTQHGSRETKHESNLHFTSVSTSALLCHIETHDSQA